MRKKTKRSLIITTFLSSLVLVYIGTTHTLGWFDTKINSPIELIKGQSTSAYFYDGKGTKENPYIITNRRHLYNLAWLQYIGHFNQADETGVITPVYFKIAETTAVEGATTTDAKYTTPADIDCSGLVLPPIGTSQYPFVGVFDGNSSIIRNYTVTDSLGDMTNVPTGIKNNNTYIDDNGKLKHCSIIGTFGVVGLLDDKVKAVDSSNSSTTFTISGGVKSSVSNFYIDQVNIKPTADNTLAGLIVGYANANVSYCGAYRSKIEFTANTSKLNAKVSDEDAFSNVSSYTLIGDYNPTAVTWEDRPGQGQQNDWGGSIDIASFMKRLNYIAIDANNGTQLVNSSKLNYTSYNNKKYNSYLYYNRTFNWNYSQKNGGYVALQNESYLPLNIDLNEAKIADSHSVDASYYTDSKTTAEPVLETNTGYIVGRKSQGNATPRIHSKTFNGTGTNGIQYSIFLTDQKKSISTKDNGRTTENGNEIYSIFKSENISLFYIDSLTKTSYRIKDSENSNKNWSTTLTSNTIELKNCNFATTDNSNYYNVKHGFAKMLSDELTDDTLTSSYLVTIGIQFYGTSANNEISKVTYSGNLKINKKAYSSYQMLDGGINFNLSKNGSIKMVVGTYTSNVENHTLPSIYQVFRNENDDAVIDSYKKK